MGFDTVTRTHVGCRRKVNEDCLLALPDLGLWAVADGMGGHHAGDVASAMVVEALAEPAPSDAMAERVERARRQLEAANTRLTAFAVEEGGGRTVGSTVVAFLTSGDRYACLWAGDSRAYGLRDGQIVQLTRDHSLVQDLVDLGEIAPADARDHPNANVITRAVGGTTQLELDLVEGRLASGDLFLLATDGLTRVVGDEEIAAALGSSDLELAADGLVERCLQRGAPDNLSFVIVKAR